MPRSRVSEVPLRLSGRGPSLLRTSTSDSDRSPKIGGDRRSPRGTQSDPMNQKKLGTRISDLESQLGQAQEELSCLKEQLASAVAAKKAAQQQLETKSKKPNATKGKRSPPTEENQQETDVFEVPAEPKVEVSQETIQDAPEIKPVDLSPPVIAELEKPSVNELVAKDEEIGLLKAKLDEKEKELQAFRDENASLKSQLSEKLVELSSARVKEEEAALRLNQIQQELETTKGNTVAMKKQLEASEKVKEDIETEMKKMRVQTEQWRKAADAAAVVLADGVETNGRRISERCGSMDKHCGGGANYFETPTANYIGSPGWADDSENVYRSGKRKGSGIRMFGDLWKRKGQK